MLKICREFHANMISHHLLSFENFYETSDFMDLDLKIIQLV